MKKKKLKLSDLKVESFTTNLEREEKQTVDGGIQGKLDTSAPGGMCDCILQRSWDYDNTCLPGCSTACPVIDPSNPIICEWP